MKRMRLLLNAGNLRLDLSSQCDISKEIEKAR